MDKRDNLSTAPTTQIPGEESHIFVSRVIGMPTLDNRLLNLVFKVMLLIELVSYFGKFLKVSF